MNYLTLIAISFVASFLIGCEENEPKITQCALVSVDSLHCFLPDGSEKSITIIEAVKSGFVGVSLDDYGKAKDHHNDLHIELDNCN